MRQVEEALARQVMYGGDLATNLLEIAPVDEGALTRLIAEEMRLPPAPAGELAVALEPAQYVPPDMAMERKIVPLKLEGEILVLAVIEPMSADLEDQLMFALGLAIEQRAATTVRVLQAITRLYGLPLDRRMRRLVARLSGAPVPPSSTPALGTTAATADPAQVPPPATAPPAGRVTPPLGSPSAPTGLPATRHPAGASAASPAAPAQDCDPPSAPASPAAPAQDSDPPSAPAGGVRKLLQRDIPAGARVGRRRRGPLTFDAAKREADETSDRNALLDLFVDFSRQFFDYAVLFLVHGDIAEGRDSFGTGASADRVVGIGVPLDLPSLLSDARDSRAPVLARAPADGIDAVLRADLQRPRDSEMAIVPLVVRTRVVAILLGDCGDAGVETTGFEQVTAFAAVVGKGLERIIVRRKLEGFVAGGRASDPRALAPPKTAPAYVSAPAAVAAPPAELSAIRAAWAPPIAMALPTSTMPPPPPNVATVRDISRPPIPREDPVDSGGAPELEPALHAADGAHEGDAEPRVQRGPPQDMDARALFDMLGWETGAEEPDVPPPSSSLAVAPHRPPLAYVTPSAGLPSIIVDLDHELVAMVDRVVRGEGDEGSEGELLRQGERAMRIIMAQFPGPVTFERTRLLSTHNPPRASDCGPLLRLVARERKVALPFVVERLSDPDVDARGWATYLLGELPYPEAIPHALARLRDSDACTRAAAVHAIAAIGKVLPDEIGDAAKALAGSTDPADRAAAMRAMGELGQSALVPDLLAAFADGDERVVATAHDALVRVTRQDLGGDARPWLAWWEANGARHRIEWLIDALMHDVSEIRRAAGEELRTITREYFGYASDLPPRDRERARQRYNDWWVTEGRARFRRK